MEPLPLTALIPVSMRPQKAAVYVDCRQHDTSLGFGSELQRDGKGRLNLCSSLRWLCVS
ncbi:hypothetical protein M9458_012859, partial [Cirrhinus mrigala]